MGFGCSQFPHQLLASALLCCKCVTEGAGSVDLIAEHTETDVKKSYDRFNKYEEFSAIAFSDALHSARR